MNIIHTITSLDPVLGGPPAVVAHLAAAQAALGHTVHVLSYPTATGQARLAQSLAAVRNFHLVHHDLLAMPNRFEMLLARQARHEMHRRLPDFDIIHIHSVWDPFAKAAADVARRHHRPYVLAPHGMLDPWAMQQARLKKRIALFLGYRRMLNDAAFLHVLNSDEQDLLGPLNLRCPLQLIPNGIALESLNPLPSKDAFYRTRPQLQNHPFILFLSRLHPKKGLDYLADAFAILARKDVTVHLVVAGPDDGAQAGFQAQITRLNLVGRVHLVGPLYGHDKLAALAAAFCFCLPSRQEGFSMAIVEALAARLPVVASRQCHFPELADANAGIITDLDPQQIADALLAILADPQRATAMGLAARNLIESRFTWPTIARHTVELYRKHLSAPAK
ncbi:MAG: glycosyltransferase [Planctomycetota bacterium]|nr:glycosyltransferase [Planctomycetota bacterium]